MLFTELLLTNLRRIPRNRGLLFAIIFFPLIFIGVFGIAFQQGGIGTNPTSVAIFQLDKGIPAGSIVFDHEGQIANQTSLQSEFVKFLGTLTYEDGDTKIFDIEIYEQSEADEAHKLLEQGSLAAIITIPEDFSLGVMSAFRAAFQDDGNITLTTQSWQSYPSVDYQTTIELLGDQSRQNFGIVASVITQVNERYFDFTQEISHIQTEIDGSIATESFTAFDYVLPGLVIFGIMQNLSVIANAALRDVESGLLNRMKISSVSSVEYISSIIVSQLIVSIVQVPIFFLVATAFGFPLTIQIAYAFIFALLVSLSMTGIGLIIAGTVTSTDSANTISSMIGIPMAFLAGAFFVVPNPIIFTDFFGYELGLMDLLPPTSAIEGIRLVLIGGRSISEVGYQLGMLSGLTVILLIIGLALYTRKHFGSSN